MIGVLVHISGYTVHEYNRGSLSSNTIEMMKEMHVLLTNYGGWTLSMNKDNAREK